MTAPARKAGNGAERRRPYPAPQGRAIGEPWGEAERRLAETVLAIAAREFDLSRSLIVSRRRTPELVRGRAFATWAMRSLGEPSSYTAIGQLLGGRDHTTVINLHEKAIVLRIRDDAFRAACERLETHFATLKGKLQ